MSDNKTKTKTPEAGKTIIAVDPGKSGAIAVFCRGKILTLALKTASPLPFLRQLRAECGDLVAYMEKVGGFVPKGDDGEGQPGSRMFVFGWEAGYIAGILDTLEIKTREVLPQVWQRGIPGRKTDYNGRKKALHAHAKRLFPHLAFTKEEADALGILHYACYQEGCPLPGYAVPQATHADDSAAVKWCKANGWAVPVYGSTEYASMIRHYVEQVA